MGEDSMTTTTPLDRRIEQAIVSLKKGAQLLKFRSRGKQKFCPFKLSTDEKLLIWYSGKEERQLRLDSITKIIPGTANFQRKPQPGKEHQSFSVIYANGVHSLDLMCKDEAQAESWMLGLRTLVSRSNHHRPIVTVRIHKGAKSCVNSPLGYTRRKYNLGLPEDPAEFSQVRSLCGSPPSLSERCLSDSLSCSSNSVYSSEPRSLSNIHAITDARSSLESDEVENRGAYSITENPMGFLSGVSSLTHGLPSVKNNYVLRDLLMWGEGIEGGNLRGGLDRIGVPSDSQFDAILPRLIESTALLDVKNISFGGKHAALVTKEGEVFCWGRENGGRLGHKVNMDVPHPKVVESMNGVQVKSVSCGEYHTCAVTSSGELYSWGDIGLGAGLTVDGSNRSKWLPHKVSGPFEGINVSSVACGEWHTAVVSSTGQLFTYGDGTFGVLGHGNVQSCSQPKEVELLKGLRVKSVACGPWHTAAIVDIMVDRLKGNSTSGKLFTWGDGDEGRLGHTDQERKFFPTCVAGLVDHDFVQVSCGRMLTVGLTNTGMVCTMGSALHGQLGNPQAKDRSIAIVEGRLKGEFVRNISSGSYHIAALTSKGKVYTWGKGGNGRLGLGDTEDRNSPTLVESLRERQVENIACGSSFTAAICLHKSTFSSEQSACSGCKMVFGFTRKKRNCYNCGLLFCRACSSKKVMNASLATDKSKPCHVCDACFTKLTNLMNSYRSDQNENRGRGQSLMSRKAFSDLKIAGGELTLDKLFSPKLTSHEETKLIGGQTMEKKGGNQQFEDHAMPLSCKPVRWGHVTPPVQFSTSSLSTAQLATSTHLTEENVHSGSKYVVSPAMSSTKDVSESDKMLTEVQRLRAQAKILEEQCQARSDKIQQYQQRIDEAWSLAREEAARRKTAKEIIKALTSKLYVLQKHSAGKYANIMSTSPDRLDMHLPRIKPTTMDASALKDVEDHSNFSDISADSLVANRGQLLPELVKHVQVNDSRDSPIRVHDTMSNSQVEDQSNFNYRSANDSLVLKASPGQNVTKTLKSEWVEQDECGVYITFITLPNGQKGLKRVRFSRKRFSEKEAEKWWRENEVRVYEKYEIRGVVGDSADKSSSRSYFPSNL